MRPATNRANKILWVSRRPIKPPDKLRIRAQRMHGDRPVGKHVVRVIDGGPGAVLREPADPRLLAADAAVVRTFGRLDLDFMRRS